MELRADRNDPCPCGSGKKYKKCHLDLDKENPGLSIPLLTEMLALPERLQGLPGNYESFSVVLQSTHQLHIHRLSSNRSLREFSIIGFLTKEFNENQIDINSEPNKGSSYLKFEEKSHLAIKTPKGVFFLQKNSQNEVSKLQTRTKARSHDEAISFFINGVSPILDSWAFEKNVPIFLNQIICHDIKNNNFKTSAFIPHKNQKISKIFKPIGERLIPLYSLYRESKNSNSVYYKFLCLHKILEGVFKKMRPETFKYARENGLDPKSVMKEEFVPDNKHTRHYYPDKIGMSVLKLYETFLQEEFRNAIAHFAEEDTNPLWLSDYTVFCKYANLLGLLEICCKDVIENEERILSYINEKVKN